MADEAADVVRRLDVDVERDVQAARIAAIWASERSVGRLIVSRRGRRGRARSPGSRPAASRRSSPASRPGGRPSSRAGEDGEHAEVGDQDAAEAVLGRAPDVVEAATSCSWPCAAGRDVAARRRARHRRDAPARVRPGEQADLDRAAAAMRAISSSSASVSRKTPLPWETRWMRTSSRAASSSTASRQRGPSVLGISTRYCAPSGKRPVRQVVQIAGRQPHRAEEVAGGGHGAERTRV